MAADEEEEDEFVPPKRTRLETPKPSDVGNNDMADEDVPTSSGNDDDSDIILVDSDGDAILEYPGMIGHPNGGYLIGNKIVSHQRVKAYQDRLDAARNDADADIKCMGRMYLQKKNDALEQEILSSLPTTDFHLRWPMSEVRRIEVPAFEEAAPPVQPDQPPKRQLAMTIRRKQRDDLAAVGTVLSVERHNRLSDGTEEAENAEEKEHQSVLRRIEIKKRNILLIQTKIERKECLIARATEAFAKLSKVRADLTEAKEIEKNVKSVSDAEKNKRDEERDIELLQREISNLQFLCEQTDGKIKKQESDIAEVELRLRKTVQARIAAEETRDRVRQKVADAVKRAEPYKDYLIRFSECIKCCICLDVKPGLVKVCRQCTTIVCAECELSPTDKRCPNCRGKRMYGQSTKYMGLRERLAPLELV